MCAQILTQHRPKHSTTQHKQTDNRRIPFSVCALNKVYTLFLHFALYSLQCPTVYKIDISDLLHFSTLFFFREVWFGKIKTDETKNQKENKEFIIKERLKAGELSRLSLVRVWCMKMESTRKTVCKTRCTQKTTTTTITKTMEKD